MTGGTHDAIKHCKDCDSDWHWCHACDTSCCDCEHSICGCCEDELQRIYDDDQDERNRSARV